MRYLVDTGVLLRLFDSSDANHNTIRTLFKRLRKDKHTLCAAAQNIAEFWNVSTRPSTARGGFGQDVESTNRRVGFLEKFGLILTDHPDAYSEWRKLVVENEVRGVSVHDARLVAVMEATGITHIITLNASDFHRYSSVTAQTPDEVLSSM